MNMPALLTSVSTRPNFSRAVLNTLSAVSAAPTSPCTVTMSVSECRLDRPRCCNNPVVTIPESLKDTRTDPLRCSRYYGYFLLCAHDSPHSKRKLRLIRPPPRRWSSEDRIPAVSGSREAGDAGRRCYLRQTGEARAHPAAGVLTGARDRSSQSRRLA